MWDMEQEELDILEVINNIENEKNLKIYIVINASKPETSTVENIVEYVKWSEGYSNHPWKKYSGIISNTHFGDETTKEDVIRGFKLTQNAAAELNLPLIALAVSEKIYPEFESDCYENITLWKLKRFMPKAFW